MEKLLTIYEAASLLNLKVSRVRTAVFRHEINYIKIGALVRFRVIDLDDFIQNSIVTKKVI